MATEHSWLRQFGSHGLWRRDRRRAIRFQPKGIVAHYWDGSAPVPHPVGNISLEGLYVLTSDRWYRGTLVTMALQQENDAGADRTGSITVETQVIHCGDTGVGCRFIFERENTHSRQSGEQADRSTLKKFLGRVTSFQEVRR